jgi:hypothetical protein
MERWNDEKSVTGTEFDAKSKRKRKREDGGWKDDGGRKWWWDSPFYLCASSADQNNVTYHILVHKLCHQLETTVTTATTQPFMKPNPRLLK